MSNRQKHLYEFGCFTLDAANRLLRREGEPALLHPKAFDTLLLLVEHRGEVLGKEDLIRRLWPDSFVEDSNLTQNIYVLRKALGRGEDEREYIKTVPKRGYQFVAEVREEVDRVAEGNAGVPAAEKEEEAPSPITISGAEQATKDMTPPIELLARNGHRRSPPLILIAGALAVGLIIGAYFWLTNRAEPAGTAAASSIAVLPFKPLLREGRDESLELGMADTLITRLSTLREIVVRPISAVRRYTGLEQDPLAAGRELGVEAVLDGSIQRVGERVRVTVRLLRVEDGRPLWTGRFDERFTDIFAVQDAISEQVTRSLALHLSGEEERQLARRYTSNPAAYQLYLRGRYFWNKRTEDGLRRGIEYFRQAIVLDPDYALAYSGLSDCYAALSSYSNVTPQESLPSAREAALRALFLDDTLAEAHTSLAFVSEALEWDWQGAERGYTRAINLNSNYAFAHHRYGMFLCLMGRFDDGLAALERARQLDPMSLIINVDLGLANYFARRFDRAIELLRKAVEMEPDFARSHVHLAECYVQKGMFDEAIAEARRASELSGGRGSAVLGYSYAVAGRRNEARQILEELTARAERRFAQPLPLAATYAALGDNERALNLLERGFEQRAYGMVRLRVDPRVDGLRSDPRFQDLVRRVGLAP